MFCITQHVSLKRGIFLGKQSHFLRNSSINRHWYKYSNHAVCIVYWSVFELISKRLVSTSTGVVRDPNCLFVQLFVQVSKYRKFFRSHAQCTMYTVPYCILLQAFVLPLPFLVEPERWLCTVPCSVSCKFMDSEFYVRSAYNGFGFIFLDRKSRLKHYALLVHALFNQQRRKGLARRKKNTHIDTHEK